MNAFRLAASSLIRQRSTQTVQKLRRGGGGHHEEFNEPGGRFLGIPVSSQSSWAFIAHFVNAVLINKLC